jgi:hypothetical protein
VRREELSYVGDGCECPTTGRGAAAYSRKKVFLTASSRVERTAQDRGRRKPSAGRVGEVAERRSHRWRALPVLFVLGLLAVSTGAGTVAIAGLNGFWFFLAVVTLSTTTLGVLIASARGPRDALSPLGLAAIFYLLGYAVGGLYFWLDPQPSTPLLEELPFLPARENLTSSVWIATFAWVTFAIGYWANPLRGLVRRVPSLPSARGVRSLAVLVAPLLVAGWLARIGLVVDGRYFYRRFDDLGATGSSYVLFVLSNLPILATGFIGAYHYLNRGRLNSTRYRTAFWVLAAIELVWAAPTGSRGQLVGVLMMLLVVGYYGASRAVRVKTVVLLAILVVFVIFPFALYYRNESNPPGAPQKAFVSAAGKTFNRPLTAAAADGFIATFSRFSDVASLAVIVGRDPSYSSRSPGETLLWTIQGLVPRAILQSKADPGSFGNEFGRTYGLNTPDNYTTSMAVTQPGELYMNFGVLGMLLMLAVGGLYRAIAEYLVGRGDDPVALAIYAALAWPLLQSHEVILASGLVGVLKTLVTLSVGLGLAIALATPRRAYMAAGRAPARTALHQP